MCGICGYLWTSPEKAIDRTVFDRMTDSLRHRGPDDRGVHYSPLDPLNPHLPGIALGHRRLSILDLSDAGRQPMVGADPNVRIVFNGEIYNFIELRRDLEKRGRVFRSGTDTEVILALYETYGADFPRYLNGMFALAIWDGTANRLILVRDRLGKKPLFYRIEPDRFLFASELNSLLMADRTIPREIDPIALDQYLTYQYVPYPRTIYRGISKLPPATEGIWRPDGDWSLSNYWPIDLNQEDSSRPESDWTEELRATLEDAVSIRLRSDVPLGSFLSGGIDSTIITSLTQKMSNQPVRTFSIGFPQKEYDETPTARLTAQRLGTCHKEFFVTPDAKTLFPRIVHQYGEPFADSSAIPTWLLCEMTRQEVTVALSGDGGDELFAGYDRYKAVALGQAIDRIPLFLRRFLAGPLRTILPASTRQRSPLRRLKRFLEALTMSPAERYLQWITIFNRARLESLYSPIFTGLLAHFMKENDPDYDRLRWLTDVLNQTRDRDFVTAISLTDVKTYLPGDILTKLDIASMRHSLEVRSPLLDHRVAELAFRMPISLKIAGRKGKAILRTAFREYLPPEVENRPKTGFGTPLDHWFRGPLQEMARDILTDRSNPVAPYFKPDIITRLLDDHLSGAFDHAYRIWSLLVLFYWASDHL